MRCSGKAVFALLLFLPWFALANPVTAWNYHPWHPFMTTKGRGLAADVVALLNGALPAGRALKLESIERRRLNNELGAGASGIVLLANPYWFGDRRCRHYLVSRPLLWVRDDLVSRAAAPIEYSRPENLFGKRLAFLPGFRLEGLSEHIRAGRIQRSDSLTSESNLRRLLRGEIDAVVIPRTQLIASGVVDQRYHVSSRPLSRSTRHLLFTTDLGPLFEQVEGILASGTFDRTWQEVLARYEIGILQVTERDLRENTDDIACTS